MDAAYQRCQGRINRSYKMLFPASMATILFIGVSEYEKRTARYERLVAMALKLLRKQVRQD